VTPELRAALNTVRENSILNPVAKYVDELVAANRKLVGATGQLLTLHDLNGKFQPSHCKPVLRAVVAAVQDAEALLP
jgi:hypothetical protein